ncbi:MAG: VanZ family protein [Candidatus Cloacimonetes bacterium]|nr:VanZ family protein [Candidatus Cloacimonadota bacterium]
MAGARSSKGRGGARRGRFFPAAVWPPVLWFALIWVVSSLPGRQLPSPQVFSLDKLGHIGVYLVLGLLTNRAARLLGFRWKQLWWVYLLLLVTAGLDELHQLYIPQRSVSVWDFAANALGLGLAFGAGWIRRDNG